MYNLWFGCKAYKRLEQFCTINVLFGIFADSMATDSICFYSLSLFVSFYRHVRNRNVYHSCSLKYELDTELYSRSKLILSSQIRSDILMNLKKRSRSSSQAYLSLIFPSSSQWSDVSLSSWQVHRETKIPLLEGRSTKSFCILLPSF